MIEHMIEQCFGAHIVQCYQQYCKSMIHLIIQVQQYPSKLLTTMNNVASERLCNLVELQAQRSGCSIIDLSFRMFRVG